MRMLLLRLGDCRSFRTRLKSSTTHAAVPVSTSSAVFRPWRRGSSRVQSRRMANSCSCPAAVCNFAGSFFAAMRSLLAAELAAPELQSEEQQQAASIGVPGR
ncbi:hypothetical protein [Streptomyces sp. NPDC060333]|uniref:hypothetical protein n=1 Tax=Streptomyces sp. NPDC060333 TaxID=3347098 RepID=UPI00366265A5